MGYYTIHTLKIQDATPELLKEIFDFMKKNEDNYYGLDIRKPTDFYDYSDSVKWYDHDTDMEVLAEKFPTVTFILHGEGEEQGDIWEELYIGKTRKYRAIEQRWSDWR